MSITNNQDKPIIIGQPFEVEFAVNEIRKQLSVLPWIDHPYFIAERFIRPKNNRTYIYPETYAPTKPGSRNYHRLTPDNDYTGMFFFYVGDSQNEFNANQYNFIEYPLAIIFSVNLEKIDAGKLDGGLFKRELMSQARRILTDTMMLYEFEYNIVSESTDLRRVYREFNLEDLEKYNRAPMQCFRFDLNLKIEENCGTPVEGIPPTIPTVPTGEITVLDVIDLPASVQENTSFLILNVTEMNSELNVSNYSPSGLVKGATVRIRKMDDTDLKIVYNKNGLEYSFVNCKTEFIDLLWNGSQLII